MGGGCGRWRVSWERDMERKGKREGMGREVKSELGEE